MGQIKEQVLQVDGVLGVHHIHIWSMDGRRNYATMHLVTNGEAHHIKEQVRSKLEEQGIGHTTLELEAEGEPCCSKHCHLAFEGASCHHHHHH